MNFLAVHINAACGIVYFQLTVCKFRFLFMVGTVHPGKPPLCDSQPCKQLINRERLCEVIICTRIKGVDLIVILAACAYNDYRHIRPGAYPFDNLNAVNIGQTKIKQDYIGIVSRSLHKSHFSVCCFDILVIVSFKSCGYKISYGAVVLDHKDINIVIHG